MMTSDRIEMSTTGKYKHITNEWIRCLTFIYHSEWTPPTPYKLKGKVFRNDMVLINSSTFNSMTSIILFRWNKPRSTEWSSLAIWIIDNSYLYYSCIKCTHSFGSLKSFVNAWLYAWFSTWVCIWYNLKSIYVYTHLIWSSAFQRSFNMAAEIPKKRFYVILFRNCFPLCSWLFSGIYLLWNVLCNFFNELYGM
jgi:hypothetical protein